MVTAGNSGVISEKDKRMILEQKVAVIVGAGSGIGRAAAIRLASEGASTALLDINEAHVHETAAMIAAENRKALPIAADVTSREDVFSAAEKITERLGHIDIWVNCAGYSKILPFLECTDEIWNRTMDINLRGCFLGCQAAIAHMNPKGGSIVNFSSESGKKGTAWYAAYCASKFAVLGLTQSLSAEFAPKGIRVNAICPGVVLTPMWDQQVADYARKRNIRPEEVMPRFRENIPLRRLCGLDDVTDLVLFLVSSQSAYMTGQSINLTGGNTMY